MVLALEALFLQACTDLRVVRREMYAVIVQCIKNEILVEPEEGSFERHSSNRIYVPAAEAKLFDEHKNSIPFEELRSDRVKVVYDGAILETYPGQIGTAMKSTGRESGNFLCDGIVNHLKNRRHHSACGFSIAI